MKPWWKQKKVLVSLGTILLVMLNHYLGWAIDIDSVATYAADAILGIVGAGYVQAEARVDAARAKEWKKPQ